VTYSKNDSIFKDFSSISIGNGAQLVFLFKNVMTEIEVEDAEFGKFDAINNSVTVDYEKMRNKSGTFCFTAVKKVSKNEVNGVVDEKIPLKFSLNLLTSKKKSIIDDTNKVSIMDQIKNLIENLKKGEDERKELLEQNNKLKTDLDNLSCYKKKLERKNENLNSEKEKAEKDLIQKQKEIEDLTEQNDKYSVEIQNLNVKAQKIEKNDQESDRKIRILREILYSIVNDSNTSNLLLSLKNENDLLQQKVQELENTNQIMKIKEMINLENQGKISENFSQSKQGNNIEINTKTPRATSLNQAKPMLSGMPLIKVENNPSQRNILHKQTPYKPNPGITKKQNEKK
jgi:hypothetical protein